MLSLRKIAVYHCLMFGLSNICEAQGYGSYVEGEPCSRTRTWEPTVSRIVVPLRDVDPVKVGRGIRHDMPTRARALHRRLMTLRSDTIATECTLSDLVARLNELVIPTILDTRLLDDENIDESRLVRLPTASLSLGRGVSAALERLGISWTVAKQMDAMLISVRERTEEELVSVTYDVTPICGNRDCVSLIDGITSNVSPDSWSDVGGPSDTQLIEIRDRVLLVVSANFQNQIATRRLLNSLLRLGGNGAWSRPTSSFFETRTTSSASSTPITIPEYREKHRIGLPDAPNKGSTSVFGGMSGGMF